MRLHRLSPLLLLFPALPVSANLDVHPMRVHLDAGRTTSIRVQAQSPRTQYVRATVKRVLAPATEHENEVDEPPGDAAAIAVTPGMFALAGGGSRLVRVIALAPVDEETAFRVYFEGVRGDDPEARPDALETPGATLGVSLVWGVLVNVLPADGRVAMQVAGGACTTTARSGWASAGSSTALRPSAPPTTSNAASTPAPRWRCHSSRWPARGCAWITGSAVTATANTSRSCCPERRPPCIVPVVHSLPGPSRFC